DDGHSAAVLAPAGDVVTDRNWTFLAEGLAGDALAVHALGHKIVDHDVGATGAERNVVFTGAAFVGMAFDHDAVVLVLVEPLGLLVESGHGFAGQRARIGGEEYAVADGDDEFLLAAGSTATGA